MTRYTKQQKLVLGQARTILEDYCHNPTLVGSDFFKDKYARISRVIKKEFPNKSILRISDSDLLRRFDSLLEETS